MSEQKDMVIVRTYSAGVHYGELVSRDGKEVVLKNTRRVWYWDGACSLSQLAVNGGNSNSKISVSVPEIILTEAIEIIKCTKDAIEWFEEMIPWKK